MTARDIAQGLLSHLEDKGKAACIVLNEGAVRGGLSINPCLPDPLRPCAPVEVVIEATELVVCLGRALVIDSDTSMDGIDELQDIVGAAVDGAVVERVVSRGGSPIRSSGHYVGSRGRVRLFTTGQGGRPGDYTVEKIDYNPYPDGSPTLVVIQSLSS